LATAETTATTTRTVKPADHPPLLAGDRGPIAMSRPGLHETVLKILRPLPRGVILDCPAGEGALAQDLLAEGFDVRCCDLYSELFRLDGVEIALTTTQRLTVRAEAGSPA